MKRSGWKPLVDVSARVYALRHIESCEYVCVRHRKREYLACYSDGDSARQFRAELGLIEHVDVEPIEIGSAPFDHFWLDGEMIGRGALVDSTARQV